MSQQPTWVTEVGSLGVIPEGRFYSISLHAYDPDYPNDPDKIYYTLLAGMLPSGIQIQRNGIIEGVPASTSDVRGVPLEVSVNTTSKFTVRATTDANRIADRTFTLTITGQDAPEFITAAGQIGEFSAGDDIDVQIEYEDSDPPDLITTYLVSGELPPGTELDSNGNITGHIDSEILIDTEYEFIVGITDGKEVTTRTFSIFVYAVGDSSWMQGAPYLSNYTSDLGEVIHNNFYAHRFIGVDPHSYSIRYALVGGALPTGLSLNAESGWIYGTLPDVGTSEVDYLFTIQIYRFLDPTIHSIDYDFILTVVNEPDRTVTWLSPDFLGYVNNGEICTLSVRAQYEGGSLQYRFKPGEYSKLPQGLSLLSSGNIVGRVEFKTFSLDGGTTTFDSEHQTRLDIDPTTFDLTYRITVEAYSSTVSATNEFTLMVNRLNNVPYNNLYAKLMPPRAGREVIQSLILDTNIFEPQLIYRADDPNFGIAKHIIYNHIYGLTPAPLEDYVIAMLYNHYNKMITLGEIQTARALDDDGDVMYEVVYSQIIDDLVNPDGESVSSVVDLSAHVINMGPGSVLQDTYDEVYPNSLENMREQVATEIGQISKTLPRWMLSKQEDGEVLGFVPAWVIAYTKPSQSGLIAYRIQQAFGDQLNTINLELDRFTLDSRLTRDWDNETQSWAEGHMTTFDRIPSLYGVTVDSSSITADSNRGINPLDPSSPVSSSYATERELTDYDIPSETVFDGGSTRFIYPNSPSETSDYYDQYVKFPSMVIVDNDANT